MSNQSPFGRRGQAAFPTLPRGEVVGTYETYPEAQSAVDVLARADFPVNKLSIVGSDLKTVERVTGKLSWGRVALAGAASGAWLGIFFGLLLVIFSPTTNFGFIIAAVLIGAGFGMLFGVVSYAINRRRRDFTSMTQVLASSYQVIVAPDLANRARNLIGQGDAAPAHAPDATPHPSDPPPAFEPAPGDAEPPAETPPAERPQGPYGERTE
ncbi:general stress protein [Leifsonia sp. Root112D2]|uniref:general stress protein n=1 Tax=Leifsonia sp. Root112D2 TaxID=1736426 RepID=UPI0006F8958F|nr:general stress protein [Leifsonia sp. Root112D2]KQV08485.1 hypothetical protein ASC63_09990 [Leifsonia sp. Root112D2]